MSQAKFPGSSPGYSVVNPASFVNVPTPEASSLGRYGDIGVSYFTGNPNISIPLYEMKVREMTLPITLDYESSGVRVNSLPTWAGQNWTLNVGGVITRTEKGIYDEWEFPKQMNIKKYVNYFKCHDKLKELMFKNDGYRSLKDNIMNYDYDMSPDEFTFHFLDKSGKFYLDDTGSWRVMSDDNLEVIFDYNNASNFTSPLFSEYPYKMAEDKEQRKTIAGFVIKDDEGNSYQFGYNRNAIEYTTNFWHMSQNEQNESWHAQSWYLTKITDRYGNILFKLEYERSAYIIQVFNSYFCDKEDENATGILGAGQTRVLSNYFFPYTVTINSPVYLRKITAMNNITAEFFSSYVKDEMATEKMYESLYKKYPSLDMFYRALAENVPDWGQTSYGTYQWGAFYYVNGSENASADAKDSIAMFRYNPKGIDQNNVLGYSRIRKLDRITVTTPAMHSYVGFRFHLSYSNSRLKLDSLQIQNEAINYSSLTGTKGVYRFRYDRFEELPSDYLTTEADHWGYYNGKPYFIKGKLVDEKLETVRNPNFSFTKIGSLIEMQYPTGGVSVFEYEPNTYSKSLTMDRQSVIESQGIGGGLRIKSIKNYDSKTLEEKLQERNFFYNIPGTNISSGELFAIPMYNWNGWKIKCELNNATYKLSTQHAASIIPLANSFGVSLGYSCVTEEIIDTKTNGSIEKHVYSYSNLSSSSKKDQKFCLTFGYNDGNTPYDEFSDLGFMRGKLLNETVYGKGGVKERSIGYKYRNDDFLSDNFVYTSNFKYVCEGNSTQYLHYLGGVYKLYYPKYDLVETQDTAYFKDTAQPLVTIKTYKKEDKKYYSWMPNKHEVNVRLTKSEIIKRGPQQERYEFNFGDFDSKANEDSILYKGMFWIKPKSVSYYKGNEFINETQTNYETKYLNGNIKVVPSCITKRYYDNSIDTLFRYKYTDTGRLHIYKELGKPKIYLDWAVKDNYLIAESYTGLPINFTEKEFYDKKNYKEKLLRYTKDMRTIINAYVYEPLFGPIMIIHNNGNNYTYKYDSFGRVIGIYDCDNKLIKDYQYNIRK